MLKWWACSVRWVAAMAVVTAACSGGDGGESTGRNTPPLLGTGGTAAGSAASTGGTGVGEPIPGGQPINPQGGAAAMVPLTPMAGAGEDCAEATIFVTRTTPTIYFVIDGSGSMCENFGGATRWQALRTALLDPEQGVIYRLQGAAEFGMRLFDGGIDLFLAAGLVGQPSPMCAAQYTETKANGECPLLIDVPAALDNAAAIDMAYPAAELGGSTPTDKALGPLVDDLIARQQNSPDGMMNPQYIILATDGAPNDICYGGLGGDGVPQQQAVLAAVDRAAASNITTFVISLAGNDPILQAHLDDVARHGDPSNPDAHTFNPETPEDLVADITEIVGGAVACDIELKGQVQMGQECSGTVKWSGAPLPCCQDQGGGSFECDQVPASQPDGWRLKDPSTIELVGDTCINFLEADEVLLNANFPCHVYVE